MSRKYYDKLYKEFACIDLTRYKEGKFGLRWRTESEVIQGKGQNGCASTKCKNMDEDELTTYELPFVYTEHNETKTELVKVKLCLDCSKKLVYKKTKEKEAEKKLYLESYLEEQRRLKVIEEEEKTKQQKKNFNKIEFYYRQPEKEGPDDNEIPDEAMSMN
jgi:protein FRA10AC1